MRGKPVLVRLLAAAVVVYLLVLWLSPTSVVTSPEAMAAVILRRVPPGTPISDARRFMESQGFECSESTNSDFAICRRDTREQTIRRGLDYVYCNREGWRELVQGRWQIALIHQDGKLTEVLVSNTPMLLVP